MTRRLSKAAPTCIVRVSAYYYANAACLVRDGDIVAAAQEERTRKEHNPGFPHRAIDYCL
jgi:carbamoyltransferase